MKLLISAFALSAVATAFAQSNTAQLLEKHILDPNQPLLDVQVYTGWKVPPLGSFKTTAEWEKYSTALRQRVLDEVVFRGEAKAWRDAKTKFEVLPVFASGPGYKVRQFRYEIIPGFWLPGLIYEPEQVNGPTPVVLNVNGHEGDGTATPYIQIRCMNLAKKGFYAINPEWLGMGQMKMDALNHYRMPQIDLTGTSGVALHFLGQKRALDVALTLPHADPQRIAVTGLSGGGWQTIFFSSLDPRVGAAMPVAGYSSYLTRAQWPDLDLGDSEQTPSDLASVADYTHLTAMMAPRPIQLANNAKDSCCFRADYAISPLLQAATPFYRLYDNMNALKYHVNHGAGHNYDQDNREAFYRFVREAFRMNFDTKEVNVEDQVRPNTQLRPTLPADNLDFHKVALSLAANLPRPGRANLDNLRAVTRYRPLAADGTEAAKDGAATYWKLKVDRSWTVPAVEFGSGNEAVIVIADQGKASAAAHIDRLVAAGKRVLAIDPFYLGESKITRRDFLYAMLLAGLGERPLALQAGEINAAARWLRTARGASSVAVLAVGPRTSLMALVAAAVEPQPVAGLELKDSFASLKDILTRDLTVDKAPELFCFGLLESFDIPQIIGLVQPRPVITQ
ncbi:MAG: acetylxylan esterase [Bryobacterales bacterium]|nr:acetylxylan esterase [Bryobacterales bacterium]